MTLRLSHSYLLRRSIRTGILWRPYRLDRVLPLRPSKLGAERSPRQR